MQIMPVATTPTLQFGGAKRLISSLNNGYAEANARYLNGYAPNANAQRSQRPSINVPASAGNRLSIMA